MSGVSASEIAVSRYAPEGARSVLAYSANGVSGLTLGQLVAAVCLRAGAVDEEQSIMIADKLKARAGELASVAERCRALLAGGGDVNTVLNTAKGLKEQMESLHQESQMDLIDLLAAVNRRDLTFTTATNAIKAITQSQNSLTDNLVLT